MATGSSSGGEPPDNAVPPEEPTRPEPRRQQPLSANGADLVSQNALANRMFQRNSERLQAATEREEKPGQSPASEARALKFAKDHGQDRPDGDQEASKSSPEPVEPTKPELAADQGQAHGDQARRLTFVKDASRPNYASLKKEHSDKTDRRLNFVKDRSQDPDRGR